MSAMGAVIYGEKAAKPLVCDVHFDVEMKYQESWSTETDRGWITRPGFYFCEICDREIDREDYFQDSP